VFRDLLVITDFDGMGVMDVHKGAASAAGVRDASAGREKLSATPTYCHTQYRQDSFQVSFFDEFGDNYHG
jgi:hypothetical protein